MYGQIFILEFKGPFLLQSLTVVTSQRYKIGTRYLTNDLPRNNAQAYTHTYTKRLSIIKFPFFKVVYSRTYCSESYEMFEQLKKFSSKCHRY